MKCIDCPYYWQDENDLFECCHFPDDEVIPAPCEEND